MAFTDAFTDTNATNLESHGSNWAFVTGAGSQVIQSNQLNGNSNGAGYRYLQTFASAHYAKAKYVSGGSGLYNGPAVRVQTGVSSYYQCLAGNNVYPGESINSSLADWDGGQATLSANDIFELSIDPSVTSTIYYKVNGVTIATYTSKTTLTNGQAGVACYGGGIIDDWEAGDLGGATLSINVDPSNSAYIKPMIRIG